MILKVTNAYNVHLVAILVIIKALIVQVVIVQLENHTFMNFFTLVLMIVLKVIMVMIQIIYV